MSIERIKQDAKSIIEASYGSKDKIRSIVLSLSSDIHKLVEEEKKNIK